VGIVLVVVILVIIGFIFLIKKSSPPLEASEENAFPYFKIQSLLTPAELSFYHVLKIAVAAKYDIFAKVRLADIVAVNEGMDRAGRGKAFNKIKAKHIDFVLCDKKTAEILCAIELDDQSHSQLKRQKRDEFVSKALSVSKIPFARFDVTRTYQSDAVANKIQLTISPGMTLKINGHSPEKILIEPDIDEINITKEIKCPKCNGSLVLRKVTRGQKQGHEFFGCSNFPQCRHMAETS